MQKKYFYKQTEKPEIWIFLLHLLNPFRSFTWRGWTVQVVCVDMAYIL